MESEPTEDSEPIVQEQGVILRHRRAESSTKRETASRDKTDDQQSLQMKIIIGAAILPVLYLTAFIITIDYIRDGQKYNNTGRGCVCPVCPDDWIGYKGKCYYFSLEKKNWASSQDFCSSQNASLLILSDNREKDFVMRYKGKAPSWIGFRREPDEVWKWTNRENTIQLEVIGEGGDCAYLNSKGTVTASRCSTELLWICNKLDACNRPNGA